MRVTLLVFCHTHTRNFKITTTTTYQFLLYVFFSHVCVRCCCCCCCCLLWSFASTIYKSAPHHQRMYAGFFFMRTHIEIISYKLFFTSSTQQHTQNSFPHTQTLYVFFFHNINLVIFLNARAVLVVVAATRCHHPLAHIKCDAAQRAHELSIANISHTHTQQ